MSEAPVDGGPPRDAAAAERLASEDVPCLRCGYNLRGLTPQGVCPECGTPIARALRGNLLIYSAPEYVAKLHHGLLCILLAIITLLGGGFLLFATMLCIEIGFPELQWLSSVLANVAILGSVGLSVLSLVGWWLFSTPDQAIVGRDTGDTPRKLLRIAVVLTAVVLMIDAVGTLMMYQYVGFAVLEIIGRLIGWAAWLVQVFASLLYVQWLANRLPNQKIAYLAGTYLWLLPLVYVLGFCVFFIGPLVATILYFILLNDVRVNIRRIWQEMVSEGA